MAETQRSFDENAEISDQLMKVFRESGAHLAVKSNTARARMARHPEMHRVAIRVLQGREK